MSSSRRRSPLLKTKPQTTLPRSACWRGSCRVARPTSIRSWGAILFRLGPEMMCQVHADSMFVVRSRRNCVMEAAYSPYHRWRVSDVSSKSPYLQDQSQLTDVVWDEWISRCPGTARLEIQYHIEEHGRVVLQSDRMASGIMIEKQGWTHHKNRLRVRVEAGLLIKNSGGLMTLLRKHQEISQPRPLSVHGKSVRAAASV